MSHTETTERTQTGRTRVPSPLSSCHGISMKSLAAINANYLRPSGPPATFVQASSPLRRRRPVRRPKDSIFYIISLAMHIYKSCDKAIFEREMKVESSLRTCMDETSFPILVKSHDQAIDASDLPTAWNINSRAVIDCLSPAFPFSIRLLSKPLEIKPYSQDGCGRIERS